MFLGSLLIVATSYYIVNHNTSIILIFLCTMYITKLFIYKGIHHLKLFIYIGYTSLEVIYIQRYTSLEVSERTSDRFVHQQTNSVIICALQA